MSRFLRKAVVLCVAFGGSIALLFADGGTLQFHKKAGPFLITVFSAPVPLRAGSADFSVMVQDEQDNSPVLDAGVRLRLSKTGEAQLKATATTAQATNKLLYAATVDVPAPGQWLVGVEIARGGATVFASGEVKVLPEEPPLFAYWLYFAVVPLGILLFGINQWLKTSRNSKRSDWL